MAHARARAGGSALEDEGAPLSPGLLVKIGVSTADAAEAPKKAHLRKPPASLAFAALKPEARSPSARRALLERRPRAPRVSSGSRSAPRPPAPRVVRTDRSRPHDCVSPEGQAAGPRRHSAWPPRGVVLEAAGLRPGARCPQGQPRRFPRGVPARSRR